MSEKSESLTVQDRTDPELTPSPRGSECTDPNLVTWESPTDPHNPMNWSKVRKFLMILSICLTTFTVSLSSSIFSPAVPITAHYFGVSQIVMALSVSLYVLGFAAGPLLWAPLSEAYGRQRPFLIAYFLFFIFHIPVATTDSLAGIMICRFLSAVAGAAMFTVPPAMAVDFLAPVPRGKALGMYMAFAFIGPVAGPIIGSWLVQNQSLGWRWVAWIVLILSGAIGILSLLTVPESCEEILLQRKAKKLRKETGNADLYSARDVNPVHWKVLMDKYMTRPVVMAIKEPILMAVTIYTSLIYGILYLTFFAYPYCFYYLRGWSLGKSSLPFLAMLIGVVIAIIITGAFNNRYWLPRFAARGYKTHPEDRLPLMILAGFFMPIGLFWLGWTAKPSISWGAQVPAGIFIGAAVLLNFLATISYIIDVYLLQSNSATAVMICVRSVIAASFPLFADKMFVRLGAGWATSLLGFLCVALIPVPFVFMKYGQRIRSWSKFAHVDPVPAPEPPK